jgi:hypothetical protein
MRTNALDIAYLIGVHHRPDQLARLVNRLATDRVRFYIHVSARAPVDVYESMRERLGSRDDVVWVPRVPVRYLGFSQVEATLSGLAAIAHTETPPYHAVQLSGQDYPLRPPAGIRDALAARKGETLLMHYRLPAPEWQDEAGGLDRIRYWYFERLSYREHVLRVPFLRRRFPSGLVPYGGSAFGALASEAVDYLNKFCEQNPAVVRFFRHVLAADELFLHTVLLNSPLGDRVANESIHHIVWPGGVHPKILRVEDLPAMRRSEKLFARKFDDHVDGAVLDLIDSELLGSQSQQHYQRHA